MNASIQLSNPAQGTKVSDILLLAYGNTDKRNRAGSFCATSTPVLALQPVLGPRVTPWYRPYRHKVCAQCCHRSSTSCWSSTDVDFLQCWQISSIVSVLRHVWLLTGDSHPMTASSLLLPTGNPGFFAEILFLKPTSRPSHIQYHTVLFFPYLKVDCQEGGRPNRYRFRAALRERGGRDFGTMGCRDVDLLGLLEEQVGTAWSVNVCMKLSAWLDCDPLFGTHPCFRRCVHR